MMGDMRVNKEAMLEAASHGYATATDLADWLVRELGLPFRQAHHITGRAVAHAEEKNCTLKELSLEDLQNIYSKIRQDVFDFLSVENSVMSRTSYGGTAPVEVRRQIDYWKRVLAKE